MQTVLYFQTPGNANNEARLAGVQQFAATASWHVQVVDVPPTARTVASLVAFWRPIGAIVECGGSSTEIDPARFRGLTTVFFDRNPRTLPKSAFCVSHDSVATAKFAARELLTTGYPNFAFVPWPEPRFWSADRQQGFKEALAINGRGFAVFDCTVTNPRRPAYQRRLRAWLASLPRPCALFAANDELGAAVATAASFTGLRVPEDLAIVSVDNRESLCESANPPLTSVVADFRRGGFLAAELLSRRLADPGLRPEHLTFGPLAVIHRASTRTVRRSDRDTLRALEYIRGHACEGISARDVLALYPCSRRLAEMRFREATGRSMMDEIHAVRLERAKYMLKANPGQDLGALANLCGFANPNSLRKFFLRATGRTMSAWRRDGG